MKEKLAEAASDAVSATNTATFLPVATLLGGLYFMVVGNGDVEQTWTAVKTLEGGQLFALGAIVLILALAFQPFQSILTAAVFRLSGSRRLSLPRLRRPTSCRGQATGHGPSERSSMVGSDSPVITKRVVLSAVPTIGRGHYADGAGQRSCICA
jgi:hypothetical protein